MNAPLRNRFFDMRETGGAAQRIGVQRVAGRNYSIELNGFFLLLNSKIGLIQPLRCNAGLGRLPFPAALILPFLMLNNPTPHSARISACNLVVIVA